MTDKNNEKDEKDERPVRAEDRGTAQRMKDHNAVLGVPRCGLCSRAYRCHDYSKHINNLWV